MGACTLVVVAGVTAIRVSRVGLATQVVAADGDHATREAEAASQAVTEMLVDDPGGVIWRANPTWDTSASGYAGTAGGAVEIRLSDPLDSDLSDSTLEPVLVEIGATVGDVRREREFRLEPVLTRLRCLDYAMVMQTLAVGTGKKFYLSGTQATIASTDVVSPVYYNASAAIAATAIDTTSNPRAIDSVSSASRLFLPTGDSLARTYASLAGATISLAADTTIDGQLFSPSHNPLGATNPRGIYVIDANRFQLRIRNSRLLGTLVVYDVAVSKPVRVESSVLAEPAEPGLPTIIIAGDTDMGQFTTDLSEATQTRNFNPTGAAYLGIADADTTDVYPSMLRGIVYIGGDLHVTGNATVHGQLFVTGKISVSDHLRVQQALMQADQLPPGFVMPTAMSLVDGSIEGN
jgi:hypothetical protein